MPDFQSLAFLSKATEDLLCPPFEWCQVAAGAVTLLDASSYGGTQGGTYLVPGFTIAKYPVTNAQYQGFLEHPNGFSDHQWWEYSSEARQWRKDRPNPMATAFVGPDLPRTRVSWFDAMAFCCWLSVQLESRAHAQHKRSPGSPDPEPCHVRLPTEQEWQRAALGDTGQPYPWGGELTETRGNYAGHVGHPSGVEKYAEGKRILQIAQQDIQQPRE